MNLLAQSAVLVTLVAALTACEGSGPDEASSTSTPTATATGAAAEPANGDTIKTDDFTYAVPDGWKEAESPATSLAINLEDQDGFSDNITVIRDDTIVGLDRDKLQVAALDLLKGVDSSGIRTRDPVQIDGEEAVHAGSLNKLNDTKYRTEQYAVRHGEAGFIVMISFSPDVPTPERDAVSESILATWKWAS
jgi:hypothetical protein